MERDSPGSGSLQLLLDSFVAVTSERDVAAILERAVDLARLSTQARYGAAVALERGAIAAFVHAGLTKAQFEALPHPPRGLGMLGAVLEEQVPIRLDRLQDDPRSVGFPINHVPMAAFLGVPIMFETELRGALYLTKPPGHGLFGDQDELFMLSLANQTAVALETVRLFDALRETTKVQTLLQDVAVAANEAETVERAMQFAIDRICAHTGWPVGHAYVPDGVNPTLVPMRLWHLDDPERFDTFRRVTEATPLPFGVGLPGRVVPTGQPAWVEDVTRDSNFPRAGAATDIGVRAGFALPVLVGSRVVAVLEFFAAEPLAPDPQLLEAMGHIGTVLGRVVERKEVEQGLLELDRAKSQFIANAAHELRTPLTTISGLATTLASRHREMDEAQLRECFEAIGRAGKRLGGLITNLLDLSQIELGGLFLQIEPVSVAEAVTRALEIARPPGETVVEIDLPDGIAAMVDLPRFDQVLTNLLTNAYRYGGRLVRLTAEADRDTVRLHVSDDGPGVPERLVPHLFEPFRRGENVGAQQGSGLGLTIVRRLVEVFGGRVSYERSEAGGARFTLDLRRAS